MPEPGNPQAFNRYSYTLNNPIKYVDPTGHFTDDALQEYLKKLYGDDWEKTWKTWLNDTNWMDLLHAAEAGDIVTMMSQSGLLHYQFTGRGREFLEGLVGSSDIVGSETHALRDGDVLELMRTMSEWTKETYIRVGIFRMVNGHLTSPYHDPRVGVSIWTPDAGGSLLVKITYALYTGWTVPFRIAEPFKYLQYILNTTYSGIAGWGMQEYLGPKEGDDLVNISALDVDQNSYGARIVVRRGSVHRYNPYFCPNLGLGDLTLDCGGICP